MKLMKRPFPTKDRPKTASKAQIEPTTNPIPDANTSKQIKVKEAKITSPNTNAKSAKNRRSASNQPIITQFVDNSSYVYL